MSDIDIRQARLEDASGLFHVWQALRWHNAGVDGRISLGHVSETEFAVALRLTLERKDALLAIAVDGETVVGMASAGVEAGQPDRLPERHVTVGYLFVQPSHRRHGLGGALLEFIERWAADQPDIEHLEMTVLAADVEASAFWGSIGFSPFITRLYKPLTEPPTA